MSEDVCLTAEGWLQSTHPVRERAIVELFARQKVVASLDQLRGLGLSPGAVRSRVATGRLHRVHRGVYSLVPRSLLPADSRWLAAVLACGPDALLSHRSAAALWGLRPSGRPTVDVLAPGDRGRKLDGIDFHRARGVEPPDIAICRAIPCTSVARTVLDLAELIDRRGVERAIDQAEILGVFDLRAFDDVLRRTPTRRGAPVVRRVLAEYGHQTLTQSEIEERFLAICDAAGLPRPEVNAWLALDHGDAFKCDFVWREARLIAETDGQRTHGTRAAFGRDRRRDRLLTLAGWRVVRFTWRDVTIGRHEVVRTVRELLK